MEKKQRGRWKTNKGEWRVSGKRRGGKDVCNVTGREGIGDSGIREIETVFFICQDPRNEGRLEGKMVRFFGEGERLFFRLVSRSPPSLRIRNPSEDA